MYKILLIIHQFIAIYTRPMWKWIIHRITGRCELLRIQYDEQPGALRTHRTESSLTKSKFPACRAILEKSDTDKSLTDKILDVIKAKKVSQEKDPVFKPRFTECSEKIVGYVHLLEELEKLRTEKYTEAKHEQQLLDLWKTLKPDDPLQQRFTKQWGDIGFQGTDPASDFRGMGLLGFFNLIYFSQHHTAVARRTLVHSAHPKYGYSFAIVGINLTELSLRFIRSGALKAHFYNINQRFPTINDFHEVYCYVFVEFDKLWMKEKPNIMQFNEMRNKYEKQLTKQLTDSNVQLSMDCSDSGVELVEQEF